MMQSNFFICSDTAIYSIYSNIFNLRKFIFTEYVKSVLVLNNVCNSGNFISFGNDINKL